MPPARAQSGAPAWWARGLIDLAAAVLPSRSTRARYRREFVADIHGLSRTEQAKYGCHLLAYALPLRFAVRSGKKRSALEGVDMTRRARRPLRCRLNLRHDWHGESADDGTRYVRCRRCGKDGTGGVVDAEAFQKAHGANMLGGGGFGF